MTTGLAPLGDDHIGAVSRRGPRVVHGGDHGHDLDPPPMARLGQPGLEPAERRREHRGRLLEDGGEWAVRVDAPVSLSAQAGWAAEPATTELQRPRAVLCPLLDVD